MSTKHNNPIRMPIWRDANRLLLEIETAVRDFPRYHKYTLGSELRREAMRICQLLSRALAATGSQRRQRVEQLLGVVDDIKIMIQLAKELRAFANFAAFQRISELAVSMGKQGGAWLRHLSTSGVRPESRGR